MPQSKEIEQRKFVIQSFHSKKFVIQILIQRIFCNCNSNVHLIQRKTLPANDFELTGPNL